MKPPNELGLPFDEWRPGQQLAIRHGLHNKRFYTVIQSPTGSGKSTVITGIMANDERRYFALTATKGLEDQYQNTFDFLYDIRGMANYPCLAARGEFAQMFANVRSTVMCDDGPCRSEIPCSIKDDGCAYYDRLRGATATNTGLTNYPMWLAMRRYGRGLGAVHGLLCDEAHALPEELMSASQIQISASLVEKSTKRTPQTHKQWAQWATARLDEIKGETVDDDTRIRKTKLIDALTRLRSIDEHWAWDVHHNSVIFEPTVPRLLMPTLVDSRTCRKVVMLSATITKATMAVLGIDEDAYSFHSMKSRFDPSNRPVYVVKSTRVDHKMSREQIDYWLARIDKIIRNRLDRKGIIHSISYDRAQFLIKHLNNHGYPGIFVAHQSAFDLAATVERFRRMKAPAILVSPSVMTGFDFPYTDCEYVILPKLPFPDTRSAIARARIKATNGYREHLTSQAIEQAVGRHVRASDDRGETFIVDDHAQWFLWKAKREGFFSESFWDAVQFVEGIPSPPPPLKLAA